MKKYFLIISIALILSCNKKNELEKKNNISDNNIEELQTVNNNKMNITKVQDNITLLSGISLEDSRFNKKENHLKKYKYDGIFIENIRINDLLQKEYRERFFAFLDNSVSAGEDNYQSTLFTDLLMLRIGQLEDKNAYFLLKESSKSKGISYMGIEFHNQYLWELFLDKPVFFITESSNYNDIELLDYILNSFAQQYILNSSSDENEISFCNIEDLESGMLLINKNLIETNSIFKKIKSSFKGITVNEIECAPALNSGWKSVTKEFYNIKPLIDQEMDSKLGVKEKLFYKLRVVPILKDYVTK
ncbi:hypothetical protein [Flavobacterium sp.]|uniref:hypothetical protein n=1 Tax=Flavobacterium sp. TaxID=239 RepID=UPI003753BE58